MEGQQMSNDGYCLYRLFDHDSTLLYVGVTVNLQNRMRQHQRKQSWWIDVDESKTIVEMYDTPNLVSDAEQRAIETEAPCWNRSGRTTPRIQYRRPPIYGPEPYLSKTLVPRVALTLEESNTRLERIEMMIRDRLR